MKRTTDTRQPLAIKAAIDAEEATARKMETDAKLKAATEELRAAGLIPVTATDLLARTFPPVEWIVEDLLAARGSTSRGFKGDVIAGAKMRKTFFALQLAACVSAGRDFLGHKVPKPRKVLYLNLELREDFAQERIRKLAAAFGADFSNLDILTPSKPYLLRNRRDKNGNIIEGFEDQLIEYIRGMGYELVIVDPQYKLELPEEDENSGQGIGGILRWRDRIITETAAACLMVHHDNKGGGTDRDLTQRGAGSSFSGRDYDTRFALDAHADGDPLHEVLECGSRVRADPDSVTVVFDTGTFTFSADTSIPAKRLTSDQKKGSSKRDTTSATARRERELAEAEARSIFNDLDTQATEVARKERRDPIPRDYLLDKETFKSRLRERAGIGIQAAHSQMKSLCEPEGGKAATLETIPEKKIKKDGTIGNVYHGATFIGFPSRIRAYARHFEELSNQHK